MTEIRVKIGRRTIRISNSDKVLFPGDGITKEDLAHYYAAVAPAMVAARPRSAAQPLALEPRHRQRAS